METKNKVSGYGISSFVLSIVGMLGFYLLSYIAVLLGIYAIIQVKEGQRRLMWLGIAGLILGILGALANIGQHFIS